MEMGGGDVSMTYKFVGYASVLTLALVLGILIPLRSEAQTQETRLEFDVASVKLGAGVGKPQFLGMRSPGTFAAQNVNLRFIIRVAYGVRMFQVLGGPKWLDSETFQIDAKGKVALEDGKTDATRPASMFELFRMLQPLLEDRFKLKVHRETRELPIFFLTVAKDGPKMQQSKCTAVGFNGKPAQGQTACLGARGGVAGLNRTLDGVGMDMPSLVTFLANTTKREVIDKTGLTGRFDFHLEWAPDELTSALPSPGSQDTSTTSTPPIAAEGPSFYAAVLDQLGLKLESTKGPVQVVVIDSVEKPDAN